MIGIIQKTKEVQAIISQRSSWNSYEHRVSTLKIFLIWTNVDQGYGY